jgi:hypothetical protein
MVLISVVLFLYAVLGPVREQLTARDVRAGTGMAPAE